MSEPREIDRWRELADLLGLPPDANPPPAPKPAAPPTAQSRYDEPEPDVMEEYTPEARAP